MKLGPFDVPGYAIGECREMMRLLPEDSIHCVVTSPPYWGLRDYGTGDAQLGLEPTPDDFVTAMVDVFREVRRVLRPDGTCWVNLGDTYITNSPSQAAKKERKRRRETRLDRKRRATMAKQGPNRSYEQQLAHKQLVGIPWRVALALQADGWWLRCDVVWDKPNPLPESIHDRPTRCHEYVFLLTKAPTYYYDKESVKVEGSPNTHPRGRHGIASNRHNYGVNPKAVAVGDPSRAGSTPRPRANQSFSAQISPGIVAHRNRRTVWRVPTQPYHGSHFATFPPGLIEPCILAGSPAYTCAVCAAPWKRQVEVEYLNPGNRTTNGPRSLEQRHETAGFDRRLERRTKTVGWEPTCEHNNRGTGGIVLDPFMGSGTTGMVAEKHGRLWLGFDNDPKCERLIRERTAQQSLPGVANG